MEGVEGSLIDPPHPPTESNRNVENGSESGMPLKAGEM